MNNTNEESNWDNKQLRNLRLRLGWSQSDLARRLRCEPQIIESIEAGSVDCPANLKNELHMILRHAEVCSDEMQIQTQLENTLSDEGIDQIQIDNLRN